MNFTLVHADTATHARIVLVALLTSLAFVAIGFAVH